MERDASTGIARVTLNNPERRNPYDAPMREQLGAYLAKAHFDVPEP
jgi:enoyl-CoA hydratase/carnithine racemase